MAAEYHTIDLGRLALSPGEGRRIEGRARPGGLRIAGQRYEPPDGTLSYRLDVSRSASGHAFRLRFSVPLAGPCMRCLADAEVPVEVDAREIDQPRAEDDELSSPYVEGEALDVAAWAHDALALAVPPQLLCRPDCLGLCPVCGASLNDADPSEHEHEPPRPSPWAKLDELGVG